MVLPLHNIFYQRPLYRCTWDGLPSTPIRVVLIWAQNAPKTGAKHSIPRMVVDRRVSGFRAGHEPWVGWAVSDRFVGRFGPLHSLLNSLPWKSISGASSTTPCWPSGQSRSVVVRHVCPLVLSIPCGRSCRTLVWGSDVRVSRGSDVRVAWGVFWGAHTRVFWGVDVRVAWGLHTPVAFGVFWGAHVRVPPLAFRR
jgi:hypothetical protein